MQPSPVVELNRAVAAHQERFYGLTYDPDSEVTVTSGATDCRTFIHLVNGAEVT